MKHTKLTGANVEELIGVENLVWGFGLFYGGLLQIIAGLCEIKRNNMFGFTAFLSYGAFWMRYVVQIFLFTYESKPHFALKEKTLIKLMSVYPQQRFLLDCIQSLVPQTKIYL